MRDIERYVFIENSRNEIRIADYPIRVSIRIIDRDREFIQLKQLIIHQIRIYATRLPRVIAAID